ncbi:hypothetical protein FQA39_LY12626 [Lamprigera yunnana]|nr:hypothetical protein FQA39_LY12626 [Lamprigera yunnana]
MNAQCNGIRWKKTGTVYCSEIGRKRKWLAWNLFIIKHANCCFGSFDPILSTLIPDWMEKNCVLINIRNLSA